MHELYSSLTNEMVLNQFDLTVINITNDSSKKKLLWDEFVKYVNSLKTQNDREKVLKFITGSTRIPLEKKIQVYKKINIYVNLLVIAILLNYQIFLIFNK